MYHPTRGGVRGGRDQFSWDDVKADKHRENYLGHSLKAPVGRWQKGKDLHWYTRDKNSGSSAADALKEEIQRIKEEEEQAMREALGLAPKRSTRSQGNKLDKHEFAELVKRGSTAEDLGAGHADAARVDGLGFSKAPRPWEDPSTLPSNTNEVAPEPVKVATLNPSARDTEEDKSEDESSRKKRRCEEKKQERHEKRRSRDSDDRRKHNSEDRKKGDSDDRRKHNAEDRSKGDSDHRKKHRKDRERRRHDSDSN